VGKMPESFSMPNLSPNYKDTFDGAPVGRLGDYTVEFTGKT